MTKTPKVTSPEFVEAMQSLREELQNRLHSLSDLLQQTQASVKASEATASDVSSTMQRLRSELHRNGASTELFDKLEAASSSVEAGRIETASALRDLGDEVRRGMQALTTSISSVQLSSESTEANWADLSSAIQQLGEQLRRETSDLSELVASAQLQAATDRDAAAEAIQGLRGDVHRDVMSLQHRVEQSKPPRSTLVPALASLAALLVGGAGTALYYETMRSSQPMVQSAPADPGIEATLASHTQALGSLKSAVDGLAASTDESVSPGLLQALSRLQTTIDTQQVLFDQNIQQVREDFLAELQGTTVARQPLTDTSEKVAEGSEKATDTPKESETSEADTTNNVASSEAASDQLQSVLKTDSRPAATDRDVDARPLDAHPPAPPAEEARLVIRNPSPWDLKLLVNDTPVDVRAGGNTVLPITKGRVKTQIASLPQVEQFWDRWELVDGKTQLTIDVDWRGDSYKLR